MKCDSCLNSRRIVSENGFHPICCLPDEEVRECLITGEHYVRHPWYREEPEYKEDCYWYSEWQDMNAHIPTCKAGKNMDSLGLCLENCKDCDSYHSRYKPINADKVRAMTDEDLALFLNKVHIICDSVSKEDPWCEYDCVECTLKWLRKEVADEDN